MNYNPQICRKNTNTVYKVSHESALRLHAEYTEYILRSRHKIRHYTNRFDQYSDAVSPDHEVRYPSEYNHQDPLPIVSIRMDQYMGLELLLMISNQPMHYLDLP